MGALILASAFCSPKDDERALRELVEKAGEIADLYCFKLKVAKADGNWLVKSYITPHCGAVTETILLR
jgi:hypothetical protein